MQIRYLSLLLLVFTEYGAFKVKNNFALDASSQAYTHVHDIQTILYQPRGCQTTTHQNELQNALKEFVHDTYHAINCIDFCKYEEALATVGICFQQIDAMSFLLNPSLVNRTPELLSFALELANGIACLKKYLHHAEELLKNKEYQQASVTLEKMDAFRTSFFQCFVQWDTKLDSVVEQVHAFETHIKAIEEVPSSSTVMHYMRSIVRNCVSHKGGNLFITITQAQMATLHADMRGIHEKLLLLRDEYDTQEYANFELDQVTWLWKWYINDYRMLCDTLKMFVEKINQNILQKQFVIPEELPWEERALLERLIALKKSTLFPGTPSTFSDIQQSCAAVTSQVLHFSGQSAQMGCEVLGRLKELCKNCEAAVTPEGSFNKFLDNMVELAQQLKEEKEIIKQIAQRVQTYRVEELIGFTDLMKNVIQLLEDIVTTDSHWGKLLQKVNPTLHDLLKSAKGNKIAEALEALKEISKTMGYKQPVSGIALICARHGTTIKLCCESLQSLVQASGGYFGSSKHYFEEQEKTMKDQSQNLYGKAYETVLKNLDALAIAQAFQSIARANDEVNAGYINFQKNLTDPADIKLKYDDEQAQVVYNEQRIKKSLEDSLLQQCAVWQTQFQLQHNDQIYTQGLERWGKYRLGWLYKRWYEKVFQEKKRARERQLTILSATVLDDSLQFNAQLQDDIQTKRQGKYEPLCTERLGSFINRALFNREKENIRKLIRDLELQQPNRQAEPRPRLKWGNLTNLMKYIALWLSYPFNRTYYKKRENAALLNEFIRNKLEEQRRRISEQEALMMRTTYKVPDEVCKRYLKLLHPLFSVV